MERNTYQNRVNKRPKENDDVTRSNKKPSSSSKKVNLIRNGGQKVYKFRVLLPNGASLCLEVVDLVGGKMPVVVFVDRVREEYFNLRQLEKVNREERSTGTVMICLVDSSYKKITTAIDFKNFEANKLNILRLNDGSKDDETYKYKEGIRGKYCGDHVLGQRITRKRRKKKMRKLLKKKKKGPENEPIWMTDYEKE